MIYLRKIPSKSLFGVLNKNFIYEKLGPSKIMYKLIYTGLNLMNGLFLVKSIIKKIKFLSIFFTLEKNSFFRTKNKGFSFASKITARKLKQIKSNKLEVSIPL